MFTYARIHVVSSASLPIHCEARRLTSGTYLVRSYKTDLNYGRHYLQTCRVSGAFSLPPIICQVERNSLYIDT